MEEDGKRMIRIQIDNKGMRVKDGDLAEDNQFLPLNSRE